MAYYKLLMTWDESGLGFDLVRHLLSSSCAEGCDAFSLSISDNYSNLREQKHNFS